MERPGSITATVILLTIGGLACLGMGALMFVSLFLMQNLAGTTPQPELPIFLRVTAVAIFVLLGGWAVATAVGVWKLRPWGRISVLGIAGLLVVMQGMGALLMLFVPFPSVDPNVDSVMRVMRFLLVAFYLVQAGIGVWWLIYFNRPKVKDLFGGNVAADKPVRPLSITIIAWHFVVAGLCCVLLAWAGWPVFFLGMLLRGWAGAAAYFVLGTLSAFLGIALLKLHPRAVDWTILYCGFFALQTIVFWMFGNPEAAFREMTEFMGTSGMPQGQPIPQMPAWLSLGVGLVFMAIPLWYLITRRAAYLAAAAAAPANSPRT